MTPVPDSDQSTDVLRSQEYHSAHLSFSRAEIVAAAVEGRPILDMLRTYTADVRKAERDRTASDEEQRDAS